MVLKNGADLLHSVGNTIFQHKSTSSFYMCHDLYQTTSTREGLREQATLIPLDTACKYCFWNNSMDTKLSNANQNTWKQQEDDDKIVVIHLKKWED